MQACCPPAQAPHPPVAPPRLRSHLTSSLLWLCRAAPWVAMVAGDYVLPLEGRMDSERALAGEGGSGQGEPKENGW